MVGSVHAKDRAGRHRVIALVHHEQNLFELAAAAEVFGLDRPGLPSRYSFSVCAERAGRLATLSGVGIDVAHSLTAMRAADTIVIAGWQPVTTYPSQALTAALLSAHERGARVVSICSGAFLLAETGLLAGRDAVTHWALADELRRRYPDVVVRDDVLYIDHGDTATSAGTAAGIDLCLHLSRVDFGATYAAAVARRMVTAPHREGGQAQYVETPCPARACRCGGWHRRHFGTRHRPPGHAAHRHDSRRAIRDVGQHADPPLRRAGWSNARSVDP